MKKKIVSIAMFAMIAVAAAWNVNENRNEVTISDLTLENVEALASNESGSTTCDSSYKGAYCGTFYPASGGSIKVYYP